MNMQLAYMIVELHLITVSAFLYFNTLFVSCSFYSNLFWQIWKYCPLRCVLFLFLKKPIILEIKVKNKRVLEYQHTTTTLACVIAANGCEV